MKSVTATYARQNWSEVLELAKSEPLMVTDHGRPAVVMMNPKLAQVALAALDQAYELSEIDKILKSRTKNGKTYTFEEVAAELGIDLE